MWNGSRVVVSTAMRAGLPDQPSEKGILQMNPLAAAAPLVGLAQSTVLLLGQAQPSRALVPTSDALPDLGDVGAPAFGELEELPIVRHVEAPTEYRLAVLLEKTQVPHGMLLKNH